MTVSSSSGSLKTSAQPFFKFFSSNNLSSAARLGRYFPRKFSLAVVAFSLITRFAFYTFNVFKDIHSKNQQIKPIEKTPVLQSTPSEIKQPIQPELKPVEVETKTQPTITHRKAARTWAQRREQLLSTKI